MQAICQDMASEVQKLIVAVLLCVHWLRLYFHFHLEAVQCTVNTALDTDLQ